MTAVQINSEQKAMLAGDQGLARQMGMRLLLDLATLTGATELVPIEAAHLSGVSPLTGGLGLRKFLNRLVEGAAEGVAVPTSLNAAGCDQDQFGMMRIVQPDFLEHQQEIVALYAQLGVRTTQSCVPYEWEEVLATAQQGDGRAAWAESNAICFGNSYGDIRTNRESGLSALACALTGYAPNYGLLGDEARRPNLLVTVTAELGDPTDFSILGDWIGKQVQSEWSLPFGPIPQITGVQPDLSHEQRKALSAAAANYGCPLLYLEAPPAELMPAYQGKLIFSDTDLAARYDALYPRRPVSLVVIGCPQASIGELAAVAASLKGHRVTAEPGNPPPLWAFTSARTLEIAERTGVADAIRQAGALLLENTCPEVVPYDRSWVGHILTNSMKAEHYIKSGLNGIPTSVMKLEDCVAVAAGQLVPEERPLSEVASKARTKSATASLSSPDAHAGQIAAAAGFTSVGRGLESQSDFSVVGEAFVSTDPITFLGYVNRETGVIEEPGHAADGQTMAGKIALFPRGTGSSVAPYVLLELHYRGMAPIAVVNSEIDQQTAPACSLEAIPYAYDFDNDVMTAVKSGDKVELVRQGGIVTLRIVEKSLGE